MRTKLTHYQEVYIREYGDLFPLKDIAEHFGMKQATLLYRMKESGLSSNYIPKNAGKYEMQDEKGNFKHVENFWSHLNLEYETKK